MIALHEADAKFNENPIRGAQFYPNCVQLMVGGNGTVELPAGVSFPGAYSFDDPGVHHDVSSFPQSTSLSLYAFFCFCFLVLFYFYFLSSIFLNVVLNGRKYQVYCSTKTTTTVPCTTDYIIPGPTVWSGAWPETTDVEVGPTTGATRITAWSSWVQNGVETSGAFDGVSVKIEGSASYVPSWPTTYEAPQPTS